jgi:hypothetical protein
MDPDEDYVTPSMCEMHHKVMEAQLEVLRQKDKALEDKMTGVEKRIDAIDEKMDALLTAQQDFNKYLIWIAVGVALTLFGVITGRALDFGWLIG